ncbi:unnamed protein product, partial [marine sediment metagenome]
ETPISWNQAGLAGPTSPPRVFDGNGRDLGAYAGLGVVGGSYRYRVLLEDLGVTVIIEGYTGELLRGRVTYELPLCEGQGYVSSYMSNTVFPDPPSPSSLLIGTTSEFLPAHNYQSSASGGVCSPQQEGSKTNVIPVGEFTQDLGLTFPVPLPLWLGGRDDSP